jgi:hypothetical protein
LAGAGNLVEPLLADAARGCQQPFLGEQMLPADFSERGDLAWRLGRFLVSARHGR